MDDARQLARLVHPRTLRELQRAGVLDARSPIAAGLSLPWLMGRGLSLGVLSQMNAIALGSKPALHDRWGTVTFRELDGDANRIANAFGAFGLKPGDRVALLLRNGREFAAMTLGAQKAGIECCPLNTWAKTRELEATLRGVRPELLVYDSAQSDELGAADAGEMKLIFTGDPDQALKDSLPFDEFVASGGSAPLFPFTLERGSPRVIIHTSGTTGTPKGAMRRSSAGGIGDFANLLTVVPYRRSDVVLCPAPMFHSFGLATFTFATALGATLVLPEKFDPEDSLRLIERFDATAASFVPVMIRRILDLDEMTSFGYDLSTLRIVLASGSAMSADLRSAANKLFGNSLYDLYGSTEAGWVAIARPEDMERHPTSVGKPVPEVEVAIFSSEGARVGPGEHGEIYVRSNIVFEGYTSGPARDEREGFITIGDVGYLDDEDYLYVEGRADDMVVVGGENVYPIEVETVIERIDGVREAAVLGVTDEEYGQVLAAFVVGNVTKEHVVSHCKSELASYKVPKRVEVLEELPRTSTGKVLKRELVGAIEGAEPLED